MLRHPPKGGEAQKKQKAKARKREGREKRKSDGCSTAAQSGHDGLCHRRSRAAKAQELAAAPQATLSSGDTVAIRFLRQFIGNLTRLSQGGPKKSACGWSSLCSQGLCLRSRTSLATAP